MDIDLTPFEALQLSVDRAGGQSATARICGKSQTAVWKWLNSSKRLPAEDVIPMETATGVSRHLLRPDIYPLPTSAQVEEPGEDCGPILVNRAAPVSVDPQPKMTRTAGQ